ncbi:MAG: N-acetyltransferase [Bacteroidota bacterium]|jgi:RimJ/RimL family protein N-acetyltransferase|nr:N-acetyltransferase [Bacteroidota bacterium]
MKPLITTERLYLREFTIDDVQLIFELNSDPLVTKYTEKGPDKTLEDARKRLQNEILPQYTHGVGRWAVFLKSNDEFIGWCGVKYIEKEKVYTLGYRFLPKHWGKGYATEAGKASLEYATNKMSIKEIFAKAMSVNAASIHVIKKLGMVYLKDEICAEHSAEVYVLK